MRILQRNLKRTTDTFLLISHTTSVLLFKFLCNIFIGVRIIKEMPGSLASGTPYTFRTKKNILTVTVVFMLKIPIYSIRDILHNIHFGLMTANNTQKNFEMKS